MIKLLCFCVSLFGACCVLSAKEPSAQIASYVPVVSSFSKEELGFLKTAIKKDVKKHILDLRSGGNPNIIIDGISVFITPEASQSPKRVASFARTLTKALKSISGIKQLKIINLRIDLVHDFVHAFSHPDLETLVIQAKPSTQGVLDPKKIKKQAKNAKAKHNLPKLTQFAVIEQKQPLKEPTGVFLLKFQ